MQMDRSPVGNYTHAQTHSLEAKRWHGQLTPFDWGGLRFVCNALDLIEASVRF